MVNDLMIYGASGYTGRLIVARALSLGMKPILAGRSTRKLDQYFGASGLQLRSFDLGDPFVVRENLKSVSCVLNAAGPFAMTADMMMNACVATGTHYIDITGELSTFQLAADLSDHAKAAGVMLMPGVGWDVIPSDCLALHASRRIARPTHLNIVLKPGTAASRGSRRTSPSVLAMGTLVRRPEGLIRSDSVERAYDFGFGKEHCVSVSMGDLVTAPRSTEVQSVDVFISTEGGNPMNGKIEDIPEGPTPEERASYRSFVLVEAFGAEGEKATSFIETSSGYDYTAESAVEVSQRVLRGNVLLGFQSPASAYGVELATCVGSASITDVES
ncbi:saccharopine dehydrogenase NADP-binding domain-containing protein [Mycobacterium syngnathidarum]